MAAPSTVLTVVKRFTYRGDGNEEWSNTYNFTGATPADSTAWRALFDALVTEEKKCYMPQTSVVGGYGYNRIPVKGDHAIWTVDLTVSPNSPVVGTGAYTGNVLAGDQAAWVRWGLDRFSSPGGKRVYLRKYFHGGAANAASGDTVAANWVTALTAFGTKMWDGTFLAGRKICDKDSNIPIGSAVSPYMTTRTLKRRPKRQPA